jgi:hypothetical protein
LIGSAQGEVFPKTPTIYAARRGRDQGKDWLVSQRQTPQLQQEGIMLNRLRKFLPGFVLLTAFSAEGAATHPTDNALLRLVPTSAELISGAIPSRRNHESAT